MNYILMFLEKRNAYKNCDKTAIHKYVMVKLCCFIPGLSV